MKLVSNTNFGKSLKNSNDIEYRILRDNYDNFLEKPLTPSMFVPCDEQGNILEKPKVRHDGGYDIGEAELYTKAKECILFEGLHKVKFTSLYGQSVIQYGKDINFTYKIIFEIRDNEIKMFYKNIESILNFDLTLTENAIKQIGI